MHDNGLRACFFFGLASSAEPQDPVDLLHSQMEPAEMAHQDGAGHVRVLAKTTAWQSTFCICAPSQLFWRSQFCKCKHCNRVWEPLCCLPQAVQCCPSQPWLPCFGIVNHG